MFSLYVYSQSFNPFIPSYKKSAADDFEHILSKNGKFLKLNGDDFEHILSKNGKFLKLNGLPKRLKVENIVSKGEIARFEHFLLLSLCFQKVVCSRGVRKRLYEGKG